MRALKVAVVMGGNSPEHDISLQSGATVLAHLPESKYERTAVVVQPGGSWCLAQGALNHEELSRLHCARGGLTRLFWRSTAPTARMDQSRVFSR